MQAIEIISQMQYRNRRKLTESLHDLLLAGWDRVVEHAEGRKQ